MSYYRTGTITLTVCKHGGNDWDIPHPPHTHTKVSTSFWIIPLLLSLLCMKLSVKQAYALSATNCKWSQLNMFTISPLSRHTTLRYSCIVFVEFWKCFPLYLSLNHIFLMIFFIFPKILLYMPSKFLLAV